MVLDFIKEELPKTLDEADKLVEDGEMGLFRKA
jgi:hypothetical protein